MTAGNEIRLLPNTHIKQGSNFRASIRNLTDNHTYPQFIKGKIIKEPLSTISIHPNPADEYTTLKIEANEHIYNLAVQIHDIYGNKMYEKGDCQLISGNNEIMINTSAYPAGMYVASIITDNDVHVAKFLKQ